MANPVLLNVGELVILRDAQRAVIIEVKPRVSEQPLYVVELDDGARVEVEADGLIRAKTYASWVAPGSNWDGLERRKGRPGFSGTDRRRP